MWPDWVSNPGPLNYESGALLTVLWGPEKSSPKVQNTIKILSIGTDKTEQTVPAPIRQRFLVLQMDLSTYQRWLRCLNG